MVLEGANTWAEGSLVELSADHVSDLLGAPVLMVVRYRSVFSLDAVLSFQRYLGDRLLGVLINQVEEPMLEFARTRVAPFRDRPHTLGWRAWRQIRARFRGHPKPVAGQAG